MQARLTLPTSFDPNENAFTVILEFHYLLMKLCLFEKEFVPKVGEQLVCAEFFRRIYAIPRCRFDRLFRQLILNFNRPIEHGNRQRFRQSAHVLNRIGSLVNVVADLAEPMPDGKGYILPRSMTKKFVYNISNKFNIFIFRELVTLVDCDTKKTLNPNVELARLSSRLRFQKVSRH